MSYLDKYLDIILANNNLSHTIHSVKYKELSSQKEPFKISLSWLQ